MPVHVLRLLVAALVPLLVSGCYMGGVACTSFGSLLADLYPLAPVCPLFSGDCCREAENPDAPFACGAPNEAKTFPCSGFHGCECIDPTIPDSAQQSIEWEALARAITYAVPPFTFELAFPFAGFETAQHLAFPVVTDAYQTFHGAVTYSPGFVFHGFTALGPLDTVIGGYGVDIMSTGTIDVALPIRAVSVDLAYVDVDLDGHQGVLDPTIQHQADVPEPGAHTFDLALPRGGDTMRGFARSVIAFQAHVTIAAGILGNPATPRSVDLSGHFTSVDPDTGDADDGAGFTPLSATVPPITIVIKESPLALLDHFLCYKSKPSKGLVCNANATSNGGALCTSDADCGGVAGACAKNKFPKGVQATLADQFGAFADRAADVKKPVRLCAPAESNGGDRHDAVTHLRGYQLAVAKTAPKPVVVPNLTVANQLGTIVVDIKAPDTLLVPVAKALGAPAPVLGAHTVDDYQCYKVKLKTKRCAGDPTRACKSDLVCGADGPCVGKFPKGLQVTLADQFTNGARTFDVKKPTRLCTPAVNGGSPIQSPGGQLMCYQVKPAAGVPKHMPVVGTIHTTGVLGRERLDTVAEDEVCIPSLELSTL